MTHIPFTQFLRPDGRRAKVSYECPEDVGAKAEKILAAGYRFECEVLTDQTVSLTISTDEEDVAHELCANGPDVIAAVRRLVMRFNP
jgi:hypothetical protein